MNMLGVNGSPEKLRGILNATLSNLGMHTLIHDIHLSVTGH